VINNLMPHSLENLARVSRAFFDLLMVIVDGRRGMHSIAEKRVPLFVSFSLSAMQDLLPAFFY
jgi:hypothetical protein